MPRYTDPETGKSIFSKTPLNESEITEGLGLAKGKVSKGIAPVVKEPSPREIMANIPPLTPQQELAPATLTPEQEAGARKSALDFLWTNKEEAKRNLIKGTTPALGITGATVGSLFGPWGTSLGYAAGERLGRGIETLTGVSKPETLPEAMTSTAKDIALARVLPWAIEKVPEIPGMVKRAVTQPWTQRGKIGEVFKTVGGELEPSLAGKSGLEGAKQTYKDVSKVGNQLYEGWKKLFPKETKTPLNNLYSSVDDILIDPASTDAEKAFANKIYGRVSYETRRKAGLTAEQEVDLMRRVEETGQTGITLRPSTIEEAYTTRSVLSEASTKGGRVGWRATQMLDALHKDLNATAEKLGNPEIVKEGQKAINFWRDRVVPQRSAVALLQKRSAEKIPSLLTTDLKTIQEIKRAMSPESFQDMKRGLITDVATKVENSPVKTGKQLRHLMSGKKEIMQAVFNEEELGAIRLSSDPTKLGRYFEEHPKTRWLAKHIGYVAIASAAYGIVRKRGGRYFRAGITE